MRLLVFALSLFVINANAEDYYLEQLKTDFNPVISQLTPIFDRASNMRPSTLPLGKEISAAECFTYKNTIRKGYNIDPFEFVYDKKHHATVTNEMCPGFYNAVDKSYVLETPGFSNLGLPYVKVIQLLAFDNATNYERLSSYFVNSANKIVEYQVKETTRKQESLGYRIDAADLLGGLYRSRYHYYPFWSNNPKIKGAWNSVAYFPASGIAPYGYSLNTVKHPVDPTLDYKVISVSKVGTEDWTNYQTLPTLGIGFYIYAGDQDRDLSKPKHHSGLAVKYVGDKEYCAFGYEVSNSYQETYPRNQEIREACISY